MRSPALAVRERPNPAWRCPRRQNGTNSDYAAICAQHLPVDPGAVGASQEGYRGRDVLWRAEAFHRVHLRQAGDQFVRFAIEEKVGRGRAGAMALTVMERPRISFDMMAVRVSIAALVAA